MSVTESSATALVRFTGLGIICFNKDRQRGEIAAIRDNKHLLSVKIQQPVFQDDADNDVIVYQDIATYEGLPKQDIQIEISCTSNPAIEDYEVYQAEEFDRLDAADVNDFRWVVNMNSLHGNSALSSTGAAPYPLTKIYIGNGLFYTHKLDTDLFFEKVATGTSSTLLQPEAFGNVAETIGVKIEGDVVNFTIRIGSQEEQHSLERIAGLPFKIEIKNMDYSESAVFSDMPDYYGYLESADGNRFDLTPIVEDGDGSLGDGGAINHKKFCHPVASDLSSIDQL